ncbi:fimbrial protein [Erwinia sp. MMLR14_017]|uniref:fimbrial protein n=1 Tax=Erwinia sp. MMLR14_017 TaxID=3093842 RepID=UPI00298FC5A6|nr:fimbrial protein [Erwinia sp. MMLR14_017]MDW8847672.1 fimbrial protein [Erwinia sp. MMLR14_017]
MTVDVKCGLNFLDYSDGLSAEVYFKRMAIAEGSLGYGLTMYLGYGGEYSNEAGSVPTGQMITTYAGITTGGVLNDYTEFSLNVPFRIVRTSSSLTPITRTFLDLFQVGSLVVGSDETYVVTNLRNNAVTVKDETCTVASNTNQEVPLGSYSASTSSGLGAGIGQTSSAIAFNVQLNCEALLSGTFDVMMQFDGDASSGLSDMGVVALNSTSTASGVGVQILNENQQPIALAAPFSVASYPLSAALVTVPLYARYYQTAATVNPGTANAVATYTISYQ